MKNLKFTKEFVLVSLKTNRAEHSKIYNEAMAKYKDDALAQLNLTMKKINAGEKFQLWFKLHEPVQHLKEYDRAISMLENSIEADHVELTPEEYSQYIQDDWQWQHDFLTSNSIYSNSAMSKLNA